MEVREMLLEATLGLVSRDGLRFTMDDLASELKISKKTVYKFFDSKEALLMAVAEDCFMKIKAKEKEVLEDPSLSLLDRIERLIIAFPSEFQQFNWYAMEEVAEKYPNVYSYVRNRIENDWEPTLQLLEEGKRTGVLREFDVRIFKAIVEGSIEHFLTSNSLGINYTEALKEMMNILMAGIKREISL